MNTGEIDMTTPCDDTATIAVLDAKINYLTELVKRLADDHETRLRALEKSSTEHDQRLGIIASGQALFTIVVTAVTAWLGSRNP